MTLRFLLAPGAGAASSSAGMQRLCGLLAELGPVQTFDYPYMQASAGGRRKAPDKLPVLIAHHRAELERLRASAASDDVLVLAGKSMGSRVGCHLSVEQEVAGLVCFGYPLRGQNGKLRDEVLLALTAPILFVQGTRDPLCRLDELEQVRARMSARSELFVVEGGDHSLECSKTALKARGHTADDVDRAIQSAVRAFCATL